MGITAIELATTKPPHSSLHPMKVLFVVPKCPPTLEGEFTDQSRRLWRDASRRTPPDRPPADELLRHPWIVDGDFAGSSKPLLASLVAEAAASAPPPPPPSSRSPTPSPLITPAASPHTPRTPASLIAVRALARVLTVRVAASPRRPGRSRAFRQVVAPAIAAAARHIRRAATGGGQRRRRSATSARGRRVDGALEGGRLTAAFAVALATRRGRRRHRGSLDPRRAHGDERGVAAAAACSPWFVASSCPSFRSFLIFALPLCTPGFGRRLAPGVRKTRFALNI